MFDDVLHKPSILLIISNNELLQIYRPIENFKLFSKLISFNETTNHNVFWKPPEYCINNHDKMSCLHLHCYWPAIKTFDTWCQLPLYTACDMLQLSCGNTSNFQDPFQLRHYLIFRRCVRTPRHSPMTRASIAEKLQLRWVQNLKLYIYSASKTHIHKINPVCMWTMNQVT